MLSPDCEGNFQDLKALKVISPAVSEDILLAEAVFAHNSKIVTLFLSPPLYTSCLNQDAMIVLYSDKLVIHVLCKYLDSSRIFCLVPRPINPDISSRGARDKGVAGSAIPSPGTKVLKVRGAAGSAKHYKSHAFGELCTLL